MVDCSRPLSFGCALPFGNMVSPALESRVLGVRPATGKLFFRRGFRWFRLCRLPAASRGRAICPTAFGDLSLALDAGVLVRQQTVAQ